MRINDTTTIQPAHWLPADQEILDHYSGTLRYSFYKLQLTKLISGLVSREGNCRLLDVGTGDGRLGAIIQKYRSKTKVFGLETFIRESRDPNLELILFDGQHIPCADRSFEVSLLCDVLHHTDKQTELLSEIIRVTRQKIIIKDHLFQSLLERYQLLLLDFLGNLRFGVKVTAQYLNWDKWQRLFSSQGNLEIDCYPALPLRKGLLEEIFSNDLEIFFVIHLN
jgi:ubiquinone/menaquinone biosynthesis C-methylase UbiE